MENLAHLLGAILSLAAFYSFKWNNDTGQGGMVFLSLFVFGLGIMFLLY